MNNETGTSSVCFGTVIVNYTPSKVEQLLELMASYFEKRVADKEWRMRFAVEHLAQSFGEPHDTIVMLIEGAFADADPPSGVTPISDEECWERIWNICATAKAMLGVPSKECRKFARRM